MSITSNIVIVATLLAVGGKPAARISDRQQVRHAVHTFFAGMKQGDTTMIRSVLHSSARLQTAAMDKKSGEPNLIEEPIGAFLQQVHALTHHDSLQLDERITSMHLRIDQGLASVWAPYKFYLNGKLLHEGVDVLLLCKTASGWQIFQVSDTRKALR